MPANDFPSAKYFIPGFCYKFDKIKKKNIGDSFVDDVPVEVWTYIFGIGIIRMFS